MTAPLSGLRSSGARFEPVRDGSGAYLRTEHDPIVHTGSRTARLRERVGGHIARVVVTVVVRLIPVVVTRNIGIVPSIGFVDRPLSAKEQALEPAAKRIEQFADEPSRRL